MVSKLKVGESIFDVVDLGQDANSLSQNIGFSVDYFQQFELVSALRSSGNRT